MTSKLINYNSNISINSSKICLSQHNLRLSAHFVEKIFIGILLPPIIFFGLIGNCLNLLILLGVNKRKIARPDILLSSLALFDALFLILFLPNSLAHFDLFYLNNLFRKFYFLFKIHILALINQCSAAAIWIILGVCFERFIAISSPLSIHKSRPFGIKLFLVIVIIATFLLTFYVHLSYQCIIKIFCNGSQLYSFCFNNGKQIILFLANSQLIYLYLHYSPIIHAVFVVFLPTVLIIFSNLGLLFALYKRNYLSGFIGHSDSLKTTKSLDLNRKSICLNTFRVEYRVTFIVTPSAIIQLFVGPVSAKDPYVTLRALTVFLVTLGKSLNFVIFCLNSASFRSRLVNFVNSKINQKRLSLTSRRSF
uniref:G-protein coupled receptors family 1 profile domain-containing protein n=1 Tax=Meloidogyne incognita TaxID=6306 RepID=A0A914ML27_MELIC